MKKKEHLIASENERASEPARSEREREREMNRQASRHRASKNNFANPSHKLQLVLYEHRFAKERVYYSYTKCETNHC